MNDKEKEIEKLMNGQSVSEITQILFQTGRRGQKWEYETGIEHGPNIHAACIDLLICYLDSWNKDHSFKPKPARGESFDFIEKLAIIGYKESVPFHIQLERASKLYRLSRGKIDVGYSTFSIKLGSYKDYLAKVDHVNC